MSWLRRLSRDRSSKNESDLQAPMSYRPGSSYNDSSHNHNQAALYKDTQYSSTGNSQDMLSSYRSPPQDPNYSPQGPPGTSDSRTQPISLDFTPAPDPLQRAFNEAIKPYFEQIELLKIQIADANLRIQGLEEERNDMHAWIDKRGLRADVPPSIAQSMNSDRDAAEILNHHLDRKMTVLNGDLHRLQDSVATPLPTSTFATTLSALLPSIEQLASLHLGAPLAFEHIIKLGGNLNSHGGESDWNNEADSRSRADFYTRLDECMVDVIRQRLASGENPQWQIGRDIKRLDKTGDFLRQHLGVQNYFPRSLDVMRYEVKRSNAQMERGQQRVSP